MRVYYNEIEPYAIAWLRNLMDAGCIPAGDIDERSIEDVQGSDVAGYEQCHFFAGIGGWALALRLAGWPDDRRVWTGSCPCPPFSSAGKKQRCGACDGKPVPHPRKTGVFVCRDCLHEWYADARHLWPEYQRLIGECLPPGVLGEQVASADGRVWLAGVRLTLEALEYAVGGADLCSAGVGAPNIRQRLFWGGRLPDSERIGVRVQGRGTREGAARGMQEEDGKRERIRPDAGAVCPSEPCGIPDPEDANGRCVPNGEKCSTHPQTGRCCSVGGLSNGVRPGCEEQQRQGRESTRPTQVGWLCDSGGEGLPVPEHKELSGSRGKDQGRATEQPGGAFWSAYDLLPFSDGRVRRIEPGTFPLAHGLPRSVGPGSTRQQRMDLMAAKSNRVGRLKGYGNAINPILAAEFVAAWMEATGSHA